MNKKPVTPPKPTPSPVAEPRHDGRGHNGSTRGHRDMAGRKHGGPKAGCGY